MENIISITLIIIAAALGLVALRADKDSTKLRYIIILGILVTAFLNIINVHLSANRSQRDILVEKQWQRVLEDKIEHLDLVFLLPRGITSKEQLLTLIGGFEIKFEVGEQEFKFLLPKAGEYKDFEQFFAIDNSSGNGVPVKTGVIFGQPLMSVGGLDPNDFRCWETTMPRMGVHIVIQNNSSAQKDKSTSIDAACSIKIRIPWKISDVSVFRDIKNLGRVTVSFSKETGGMKGVCLGLCVMEQGIILSSKGNKVNISPVSIGGVEKKKDKYTISSTGEGILETAKILFSERQSFKTDLVSKILPNFFEKVYQVATHSEFKGKVHSLHSIYPSPPLGRTLDLEIRKADPKYPGKKDDLVTAYIIDQWCGFISSDICEVRMVVFEELPKN